jgi:hypothetical protein
LGGGPLALYTPPPRFLGPTTPPPRGVGPPQNGVLVDEPLD